MRWAALALVLGCSEGLPPEGQVLLHVESDAPLPGEQAAASHLFDRLQIDVFPPGDDRPCPGCSREFALHSTDLRDGSTSIGIVPQRDDGRVRVRLYRGGGTHAGVPRPASAIDRIVRLPHVGAEGIVDVTVALLTDEVGTALGTLAEPLEPTLGAPAIAQSTWPSAAQTPCTLSGTGAEVCIPGGAFWMGDPRLHLDSAAELEGSEERLVVLGPFFLDAHEVTVAQYRASGLADLLPDGTSTNPREAEGGIDNCTYTSEPGSFEDHPVNCLSWTKAAEYCETMGKSLPSEAQFEFAASGRRTLAFVWGSDEPRCDEAVYGRTEGSACEHVPAGTAPIGSGLRDRLAIDQGIVDLAGNVREWTADRWNSIDEACWQDSLLFDPVCDEPSPTIANARVTRGGDWESDTLSLRAALRTYIGNEQFAVSARIGFRCSRPGR